MDSKKRKNYRHGLKVTKTEEKNGQKLKRNGQKLAKTDETDICNIAILV